MEKISPLFILLILLGICRLCVLQEISADLRSVSPGEIITLHCSISTDYEISWYHQNSEQQMKLLVSAERGNLNKLFSYSFNINEDHYDIIENSSLVIIGVNDTDLGLYYCGGRNRSSLLQFGKPITLTFNSETETKPDPAEDQNLNGESSAGSADPARGRSLIITLMCVCSASILINIIGVCVFCYRVQVQSVSPHILWRDNSSIYSVEKEQNELQDTSPVNNRDLSDTANENTESSPDTVTYAKVLRSSKQSPT